MMKTDEKLGKRAELLFGFFNEKGRMPSFSEMLHLFNVNSKNAVHKIVKKLEERGVIQRDHKGRLIIKGIDRGIKLLGIVEAGFPSPAEEELLDKISLDQFLVINKNSTFLLKVSGDSMIEAGILPGDLVLTDRALTPRNGDIVIAEVDGYWTMKYFYKKGEKIFLKPANKKYSVIEPKKELKIAGVVVSVIRKLRG